MQACKYHRVRATTRVALLLANNPKQTLTTLCSRRAAGRAADAVAGAAAAPVRTDYPTTCVSGTPGPHSKQPETGRAVQSPSFLVQCCPLSHARFVALIYRLVFDQWAWLVVQMCS